MEPLHNTVESAIRDSLLVKARLLSNCMEEITEACTLMADTYQIGAKVILMGNGGSAADAQHLAAEMVGRFRLERCGLPAIALNCNSSSVTAIGNDYGYDQLFSRQLEAFGAPGDLLIALSTSGKSKNIIEALKLAEGMGIRVVSLVGKDPSIVTPYSDVVISVPSGRSDRIQEAHIMIGHIMCEYAELVYVCMLEGESK
jgi:D-sedoheptulose 7-phosphate isomerase